MQESEARILVERELTRANAKTGVTLAVTRVVPFEHGWVVFYADAQGRPLGGNAPYIVDARTGQLIGTGTARATEFYVDNYVRTGDPLGRGGPDKVAEDLELPSPAGSQDWGIEHADPRRFGEFAQYFTQMFKGLNEAACEHTTDLVLQSANEALEQGLRVNKRLLARVVTTAESAAPNRLAYWRALTATTADPRPITKLLSADGLKHREV
ncbi:hypothetical protein OJ998_09940 [Solirubrobacter taibaiensis]|nr:hypothetical protein [Solirubrobacter taibaiensis]